MSILVSNEIYKSICDELQAATESVQIMTAFGKTNAVSSLIGNVHQDVPKKRIMFRFRLDDVIKGSTDFDVIDYCRNQGWEVFIRFDLHAKTYVVDNKRGIIGSANATSSGLALKQISNYEMAALVDIERKDLYKIDNLFNDAIPIDDELWIKLLAEYRNVSQATKEQKSYKWSSAISSKFVPTIDSLFSYELPEKESFSVGEYIQFLEMTYDSEEEFRDSFRWSRAYLWMLKTLSENGGCLYFGEMSSYLHKSLVEDPRPYRKDVKNLLANMLNIASQLDMDEVIIDRPKHSQRIRLNSNNN